MAKVLSFVDDTNNFENALNDWASTIVPGPGQIVVGGMNGPVKTASPVGRTQLLLYHDFSDDADGSPNGRTADVGGVTWNTTGTVPPTVTSGKLSANGSGYLWTTFASTPIVVEAEVSFGGSGIDNSCCTIAIAKENGSNLIHNIAHMIYGPTGATLQLNKDNLGTFDIIMDARWPEIPKDGTKARIRLEIEGDRAVIWGPDGSMWTTRDRRISNTLGSAYQTVFWQANTSGACQAFLNTASVFGVSGSGQTSLRDHAGVSAVEHTANPPMVVGGRGKPTQVRVGAGVTGGNSVNPTVVFGVAASELRAVLQADAAIGATTISLDVPLYGFSSVTIGYGNQAETTNVVSTSGASAPYTITVAALTKAHTYGEPVTSTSNRYVELYYNMVSGFLVLPANTQVNGALELGTNRDTQIARSASRVIAAGSPAGGVAVFKHGSGNTAARLSASSVGVGAEYFDTTLNKPIWSDGTNWRDATGTTV